jgi:glyoxylase-like metal-dependent hydrolase (beta-lactamase superfamily II)/putative methionine-R-sulfoxide reductase with GAF domain
MARAEDLQRKLAPIVQGANAHGERALAACAAATTIRDALEKRWVGIYDVTSTEVRILGWSGSEKPDHPSFDRSLGLTGSAVSTGATVVSQDVTRDSRYLSAFSTTRSEMIVPITDGDGVIGTIDVESETPNSFSVHDIAVIEDLASDLTLLLRPPVIRVGDVGIVPLLDARGSFGTFDRFFSGPGDGSKERAEALYPDLFEGEQWVLPFRSFLARSDQTILIDAGVGPANAGADFLPERQGWLVEELARAGVGLEDVDAVVFTHLHADHIGWAASDNAPAFPRARYLVHEKEWRWTQSAGREVYADYMSQVESKLTLTAGEYDIADGVVMIPTPGHTPGHVSVSIGRGKDRLLVLGDVAVHPIQLLDPRWNYALDEEPGLAASTRDHVQTSLREDVLIACGHYPGSGLGYPSSDRHGFAWRALDG